jgi:hypothetical protein
MPFPASKALARDGTNAGTKESQLCAHHRHRHLATNVTTPQCSAQAQDNPITYQPALYKNQPPETTFLPKISGTTTFFLQQLSIKTSATISRKQRKAPVPCNLHMNSNQPAAIETQLLKVLEQAGCGSGTWRVTIGEKMFWGLGP